MNNMIGKMLDNRYELLEVIVLCSQCVQEY